MRLSRLRCVVERITFRNPENGYSVIKVKSAEHTELVTVVGTMPDIYIGSVLAVDGYWKNDPKFGPQFVAQSCEETMPATVYGIEKYLGSGLIKGIGPKFAKKIVAAFGTDTIEIIEDTPQRLLEIKGIGKKRVSRIIESWERQKEIKNIMLFLQDHGVSTTYAHKIYKQYGEESIAIVKENPYRLADDIWGIGFKTADAIAQTLGFEKGGYPRCRSGIFYTFNMLADEGHVFAGRDQLLNKAADLLETENDDVETALDRMIAAEDLVFDAEKIYLPAFYYAETGTASRLKEIAAAPSVQTTYPGVRFDKLTAITGIEYEETQQQAIQQSIDSKIMILTGGPGTGKTTTTLGMLTVLKALGLRILLAAPTGRAAKRMSEATGMEAKTIHRLLEFKPPEGYQRNSDNPLEGDVLILDECSMIDIILMNALLKAVPSGMKLIMVGDIDQLPSVGAGNVLRDIIDSDVFPVVRLNTIFRQAMKSRIITNAHRINDGKFPDITNETGTDFFFIEQTEPDKAAEQIVELVEERLPKYTGCPSSSIQVLTPMQKGTVGAINLNTILQAALNPSGPSLYRGGRTYRSGDRVMQIRNNYEKDVFNGDVGKIVSVDTEECEITVDFDGRSVSYELTELDELVSAYAVTVHKAQGSEYPVVVMPLMMSHFVMLQRNLLYTGITRAKKLIVIVGEKRALSYAVKNLTVTRRNTALAQRLRDTDAIR